jgi:hypothetical protein
MMMKTIDTILLFVNGGRYMIELLCMLICKYFDYDDGKDDVSHIYIYICAITVKFYAKWLRINGQMCTAYL